MGSIIKHQFFYPNPPGDVWEYLTKPELIALWLMKNDFQPILGHEFKFTIHPMPDLDFDGIFYCKVLEITPLKSLSYSWKFGPGNGTLFDSVVEWTLTEKDNGTELQLVHRTFKDSGIPNLFNLLDDGWLKNVQKINKLLNATSNGTTKA